MIHTFLYYQSQTAPSANITESGVQVLINWILENKLFPSFEVEQVGHLEPARLLDQDGFIKCKFRIHHTSGDNPIAENGTILDTWDPSSDGCSFPFGTLGEDDRPFSPLNTAIGWHWVRVKYDMTKIDPPMGNLWE
jgi:hypothetical protein